MSLKFGIVNLLNCTKKHPTSIKTDLADDDLKRLLQQVPNPLESEDSKPSSHYLSPVTRPIKLQSDDAKLDLDQKETRPTKTCSPKKSPSPPPRHEKHASDFLDKSSTTTQQILANLAQFQLEAALVAASANLASPVNNHLSSPTQWGSSFVPSAILNQQKTVRDKLLSCK